MPQKTSAKKKDTGALSLLQPDQKNANKGNQRGRKLLAESLRELGAGRFILLDNRAKTVGDPRQPGSCVKN